MCICINCKWVDKCITYHDVENNHDVDNICKVPNFKAFKPYIHVSIVKDNIKFVQNVCKKFYRDKSCKNLLQKILGQLINHVYVWVGGS